MTSTGPVLARDLVVSADYGQIYIFSPEVLREDAEGNAYLAALDDATGSGRFVGVANGLIDLLTPGQWNWETPMRIEVWTTEPDGDTGDWDHEVDLDLDVPDGRLVFEASGGGPAVATDIPAARYRVRVSGRGFSELGHAGAESDDEYRLRLWPRDADRQPVLRKGWPGWQEVR